MRAVFYCGCCCALVWVSCLLLFFSLFTVFFFFGLFSACFFLFFSLFTVFMYLWTCYCSILCLRAERGGGGTSDIASWSEDERYEGGHRVNFWFGLGVGLHGWTSCFLSPGQHAASCTTRREAKRASAVNIVVGGHFGEVT